MDNLKTSETLEMGSVESRLSQTKNPCSKILKGVDSGDLCNTSEKCASHVNNCNKSEVSHEILAREVGNVRAEEYIMCDGFAGNDQIDNGSFDVNIVESTLGLTDIHEVQNGELPTFDGDLEFSGNGEIRIDESVESKGDDVLHSHDPDSPTKIDVSGNDINVFVEVFGPLDGMYDSDNDVNDSGVRVFGELDADQEYAREENRNLSVDIENVSAEDESGDVAGEPPCMFSVGDLVWVKTRTQLWWPGMISDPSNAVKDANKSEKKGCFLIKYYGSSHFVWCPSSDMKPFHEYFEQMSGQNNSRNFMGSVEKALSEIGRRVESKMICPCFLTERQALAAQLSTETKEECPMSMDNLRKYDVLSLSQFAPARFVSSIKNVARSGSVPNKIELTVMKNCLSAFYCSVGHRQLPLRLLRPSSDTVQSTQNDSTSELMDEGNKNISGGSKNLVKGCNDDPTVSRRNKRSRIAVILEDNIVSSGKGSEARERKKSKYLSYPYVDVKQGEEPENLNDVSGVPAKSRTVGNCSGSTSRKKGARKPLKGHNVVSRADDIDACPAELLNELRSTALDCFYFNRSKYSGSLKRFYGSFRKFAFLDAEIAGKHAGIQQEHDGHKLPLQNSDKPGQQIERVAMVKESQKQCVNLAAVNESYNDSVSNKSPESHNPRAKGNDTRKRNAKKKKEEVKSEGLDSITDSSSTKENVTLKRSAKKKKKEVKSEGVDSKTDSSSTKGNVTRKRSAKKKKEEVKSEGLDSLTDSFGTGTNITPSKSSVISFQQPCSEMPESETSRKNMNEGANPGLPHIDMIAKTDLNQNHLNFSVEHVPVGGSCTDQGPPLPEKRKEGVISPNTSGVDQMMSFASVPSSMDSQVTQNISQLIHGAGPNGSSQFSCTDFVSNEPKILLAMGLWPPAGKPERKKRKRKEKTSQVASVIPDLNGSVTDTGSLGNTSLEGNLMPPEEKPQEKKRRIDSNGAESGSNVETNRVPNILQDLGGSLLLNFAPGFALPSKETFVASFSRFGLLRESGIQILNDTSSAEIMYERSSDARFAFRSLEKSNPFGESLATFSLSGVPDVPLKIKKKRKNLEIPRTYVPVNLGRTGESRDLAAMKQNVEMMKLALEKAGSNISPEMRAKLENEIRSFLTKYGSPPS